MTSAASRLLLRMLREKSVDAKMPLTKKPAKTLLFVETTSELLQRTAILGKSATSKKAETTISNCKEKTASLDLKRRKICCSRSEGTLTASELLTIRTEIVIRAWPKRRRLLRSTPVYCRRKTVT